MTVNAESVRGFALRWRVLVAVNIWHSITVFFQQQVAFRRMTMARKVVLGTLFGVVAVAMDVVFTRCP